MTARATVCLLALAASGALACFPPAAPSWLEGDEPELLAARIEVTDEGELSEQLAPVPADRTRVEALPGDRIGFRPWVLTADGVLPEDAIDAAYFACSFGGDCLGAFTHEDATLPCDGTVVLEERPCAIGRGPDARYTIPTPTEADLAAVTLLQQLVVVAGEPDVRTTDDCIDELREPPYESLRGCLLLERAIPIGPQWVLAVLLGIDSPDGSEIPPEVLFQAPNFNPELERFTLDRRRLGMPPIEVHAGDRVDLQVGEQVRLAFLADPRDAQQYAISVVDGNVLRNMEGLTADWYANARVSTDMDLWQASAMITWTAREPGEVRFDVLLQDGIGGLGWGSLVFDVQ